MTADPDLDLHGPGLHMAIGGAGLRGVVQLPPPGQIIHPPGVISVEVNGPIERALLYWGGRSSAGNPLLLVDGLPFVGESAGREGNDAYSYRADLTAYVQGQFTPPDTLVIEVDDPTFQDRIDGATLVVVYTDPSDTAAARVKVYGGADYASSPLLPAAGGSTTPVRFAHGEGAAPRSAELGVAVGGATAAGADRIEITGNPSLHNRLVAANGALWDTFVQDITIPAGLEATTVEVVSPRLAGRAADSMNWVMAAMRVPCTARIGDMIWRDDNGDGLQQAGESGIAGVGVLLYRAAPGEPRELVAQTISGPDGSYEFDQLCADTYEIEIDQATIPADLVETTPHAGTTGARDSDMIDGVAMALIPTDAKVSIDLDAGFTPEIFIGIETGACCFENGSCAILTEDDCEAAGGVNQGPDTACSAQTCQEPSSGACCFDDGSCIVVLKSECAGAGGIPQEAGTDCNAAACEPSSGACCFTDGSCIFVNADDCAAAGGVDQGPGIECAVEACPPSGACCFEDGSCIFVTESECAGAGGTPQGAGIDCNAAACQPFGACCFTDGSCIFVDADDCAAAGGIEQGAGTECAVRACLPSGACCFDDGSCIFVSESECIIAGGMAQGDGVDCASAACEAFGACCFEDGSCTFVTGSDCAAAGGIDQGAGTECAVRACLPSGACCFEDGSCIFVSESECIVAGGMAQGDGVDCASAACVASGACCFEDGSCTFVTADDCSLAGGAAQGDRVACAAANCRPHGACCFPDGTCSFLPDDECDGNGGVFQGNMIGCGPSVCPPPPGPGPGDVGGGATEKGSLVVFSKVEIRWTGGPVSMLKQDTFLSLTNDAVSDVDVQMYFINGDPPLAAAANERAHPGWNWVDNSITLTGNEPTYWSVLTGQPKGVSPFEVLDPPGLGGPGRPAVDGTGDRVLRGYVLAWAVNADGEEIRWNHLAGNGTVVSYVDGSAWEYNSFNHVVVSGVPNGQPSDGTPGRLALDGVEYSPGPDQLLLNFQAPGSTAFGRPGIAPRTVTSDTDLTLLPISADLRQETDGPVTTKASITVWNQNEVKLSGTHRCLTCWDQTLLSLYGTPNHFLLASLQTDHGKARIDGLRSQLCDVDFDLGDGLPLGDDPRDIVSEDAALHGVFARLLAFDTDPATQQFGATGGNLIGMGRQDALVEYDVVGGPPESHAPPESALPPMNPTRGELEAFIDAVLRQHTTTTTTGGAVEERD